MLSIGEFSRATALTVKTLRHYHERGILVPSLIDADSGYRYYDESKLERASLVRSLKALEFSLDDIAAVLEGCSDDADALEFLERKRAEIAGRLTHLQTVAQALDSVIHTEKEAHAMTSKQEFVIEEKQLADQLIAGIRMRGRFEDSKAAFKRLGRTFGFGLAGKPGMLIYDEEYKETDADFEPFFPISKRKSVEDGEIVIRVVPGGPALCLVHRGPYNRISSAYGRLFAELQRRGAKPLAPSREVYLKGPGMLFRGNPERYLTEVQLLIAG